MADLSIPIVAALVAALLLAFRIRRLSARPSRVSRADPRPRALAEAIAAALAVLLIGWALIIWLPETEEMARPAFTALAMVICLSQYRMTMNALRRT